MLLWNHHMHLSTLSGSTGEKDQAQQEQQQQFFHRPIFTLPPVEANSLRQCASRHLDDTTATSIEKMDATGEQLSSDHQQLDEELEKLRVMDYIGTLDSEEFDDLEDEANAMSPCVDGTIDNHQVIVIPPPPESMNAEPNTCTGTTKGNARPNTVSRRSTNNRNNINQRPSRHQGRAHKAAMRMPRNGKHNGKHEPKHIRNIYSSRSAPSSVTVHDTELLSEKPMEEFYVSKRIDANFQHDRMADTDDYEWDDGPRQTLRKKLKNSHEIMRDIDFSIKDDMLLIHRTCRSIAQKRCTHPKLRQELQRLGAESIMAECVSISLRIQRDALRHWLRIVKDEIRTEKVRRYRQYQSLNHLDACIDRIARKRLAWACLCWIDEIERQRKGECISAAIMIQSQWRIKRALDTTERLRIQKWHWAVSTLQRLGRGLLARRVFRNLVLERNRTNAALVLQCSVRCRSARLALNQHRTELKRENSAIMLQKAVRGHSGRRVAQQAFDQMRRRPAAVQIQRISRGRRDRLVIQRRKTILKRNSAATAIQKHIRRLIDTKVVMQLREEREKERREMERVILILQQVYHGHRGRITMKRMMYDQILEARRRHNSATRIQGLHRRNVAKQKTKLLRLKAKESMIGEAQQWVEMWSDGINTWYCYNDSTNESLWDAPLTGYTNADSLLVLQNGRVIFDPRLINNEDARKCADCETKHASHYCEQCEEVFCSKCVTKVHQEEEFASHKHTRIGGPIECSACHDDAETVPALRWCATCDVPFCLSCWDKLHQTEEKQQDQATEQSVQGTEESVQGTEQLNQGTEQPVQGTEPSDQATEQPEKKVEQSEQTEGQSVTAPEQTENTIEQSEKLEVQSVQSVHSHAFYMIDKDGNIDPALCNGVDDTNVHHTSTRMKALMAVKNTIPPLLRHMNPKSILILWKQTVSGLYTKTNKVNKNTTTIT